MQTYKDIAVLLLAFFYILNYFCRKKTPNLFIKWNLSNILKHYQSTKEVYTSPSVPIIKPLSELCKSILNISTF